MMRGSSAAVSQPASQLVSFLTNCLSKLVVDETGLTGKYDWNLPCQPGQPEISIRAAGAIGLELVPARRAIRMLVVR
jgi:uncharacterized protein (TIGR03435 family)